MNTLAPNQKQASSIHVFFKEHKKVALILLAVVVIVALIIAIVFVSREEDDGIPGDSSKPVMASMTEDLKALKNYKIADFLPISSADPAYTISYLLDRDDSGNYSFRLVLNAFAASARDDCVKRLLSENFGGEDPLKYEIEIENYYNPFTNYSLNELAEGSLPTNFQKSTLSSIENTPYSVQVLKHTLYDGSTNTYRYVLENNQPKTLPKLFFTYSELPFLSEDQVKALNQL